MRIALPLAALATAAATAASASGHLMPMQNPELGAVREFALKTGATTPHLNYYGGPVLANVKVYAVFWGPNVNSTTTSKIGGFFTAITQSVIYDWLSEYDTNVTPTGGGTGTNQHIGHGTFAGNYTITPSTSATTIDDAAIQTELVNQIKAGHLPAADSNTIYMTYFPPGVTITNSGSSSCSQFCAYHGTIAKATAGSSDNLRYGVMPDLGGACAFGCGSAATSFDNMCSVTSHELVEATTDADVGLAQSYGPPLAWYDPQGSDGEIGDICNGQQGSITVGGATYTVQKEWSNAQGACIVNASDAFAVSVSPGSQNLAAGSTVSYTVSTATKRGATQTINLSTSGLPSGVTGSFSPATVTAGGTSTLTLTASSSATNGTTTFNVNGQGSASSASATADVVVSGGSGGGGGGCPAGTIDIGGVCVPGGCSSSTTGFAWALPLAACFLALVIRRRKA